MKNSHDTLKATVVALLSNTFVTILKFLGWMFSGSPSMLAESMHSLADTLNQSLLLAGIKQAEAKAPQDPDSHNEHPWGKGPIQYLFNFMSAIGIFFIGCLFTIYHAVSDYLHPQPIDHRWVWLNLGILTIAFFVEGFSALVAIKGVIRAKGKKSIWKFIKESDDPTLVGILLEDTIAVSSICLAFTGILLTRITGSHTPDIVMAIIIGLCMGFTAIFLGMVNAKFLIGRSSGEDRQDAYIEFIESLEVVEKVLEMKTEVLGPNRIHISFKAELHGMLLIDRDVIEEDAELINSGEEPAIKVLMDVSERMVRTLGRSIIKIENKIKAEFPEVVSIDLEIN